MEGGRPGRSVVLRGDIDALPVQEDEARAGPLGGRGRHARLRARRPRGLTARCGLGAGVAAGGPARVATSSCSSPAEEALCGAKTMLEHGALTVMEGARLVGFHVTSQAAHRLRRPARRHRHVRGELAAHHADGAGRSRRHADSARVTSSGPRRSWSSRLGEVAAGPDLRGDRLRVQRRHDPRRDGGQRGAHLGPGHRHAAHLHRGAARGGPRPPAGRCATRSATTRASTSSWRCPSTPAAVVNDPAVDRAGGGGGRPSWSGPNPGVPHAARRRPSDDVSEFLRPPARAATSSWVAAAADGSSGMHHSPTFLGRGRVAAGRRRRLVRERPGIGRAP